MKHARTLAARTLGAVLALAALAPAAHAQETPTARQVLDRYIEAVGGRAALAGQQYRTTRAEMSMPAMGMTMTMETYAARPNKMAMRMEAPGLGEIRSGYDGQVGWSLNPMAGPSVMQGRELEQAARQADFESSYNFEKFFPTMETVGRIEMNGEPCWNVRLVTSTGDTTHQCFSVASGLLVGGTATASSMMGEMETTVLVHDYRDFGGVKIPTRTVTQVGGQEVVLTVKEVSFAPIDPSVFALPAEIQAMVKPAG